MTSSNTSLASETQPGADAVGAIAPCLWFDGNGLEAAEFYVSLFNDSAITNVQRLPDGSPLLVDFTLRGRPFQALNGGPQFHFTEAISLSIPCESQAQADDLWATLTADGGEESRCGWLKDRFGVSWQVIPPGLGEALFNEDPERAARAQAAMLEMNRLDVAAIRAAADGTAS